MRRTWATPRGILTLGIIDLSAAALLIIASVVLLMDRNPGCIVTLLLGLVALIGGAVALYAYSAAKAAEE